MKDQWTILSLVSTLSPVWIGDPARILRSRQHSSRCHQSSQALPTVSFASTRWQSLGRALYLSAHLYKIFRGRE